MELNCYASDKGFFGQLLEIGLNCGLELFLMRFFK